MYDSLFLANLNLGKKEIIIIDILCARLCAEHIFLLWQLHNTHSVFWLFLSSITLCQPLPLLVQNTFLGKMELGLITLLNNIYSSGKLHKSLILRR